MNYSNREIQLNKKFTNPYLTAKGEKRAWVNPVQLKTVWFNTGTLCNLSCRNCYIESSPKNDRLEFITAKEVIKFLDEIENEKLGTSEVAFTGGEPFLNPEIEKIIKEGLNRGYNTLVLTNATLPLNRHKKFLEEMAIEFGKKLKIRVSVDHFRKDIHENERGTGTWEIVIKNLKWISNLNSKLSLAGRGVTGESLSELQIGYSKLIESLNLNLNPEDQEDLVVFPEMNNSNEVSEITTKCWEILGIVPDSIMCATSRMIVKFKGDKEPSVISCTLLPYDDFFNMGKSLKESLKPVYLKHSHCAQFCVLGGGSCNKT